MNTYTTNLVKDKGGVADPEDYEGNVIFTFVGPDGNSLGTQAQSFWLQNGKYALKF
jgi:beta-glucosidase